MFYGPGLTDADIGGVRGSLLFMNEVGGRLAWLLHSPEITRSAIRNRA